MKTHTTNYSNVFIETSEDCPVKIAEIPPDREPKTAVRLEYEMLADSPYSYTSDDVIYETKGVPKGINRETFFSKGQPCFRASALTKRYGWGVHSDAEGKIAIYAMESPEYSHFVSDESIEHIKAMRNKKK
ncbi:DUF6157 family protein [Lacrimispora sp.]|uniref:DUF6157 family protein n=1 Tax=Lacrimispora sp. TaxID=2719234 RepID=UPI002FD88933